jgi:protein-tyrosine phosphatase
MPGSEAQPSIEPRVRVLFVCLGNICRSPTAEAILEHHVVANDLEGLVEIDSAGTGGWHTGDLPDERARDEATRRGLTMTSRARTVHAGDLDYYDLILAMDASNLADLHDLASSAPQRAKIRLLREFDSAANGDHDVPDPYYGGPTGFADVFDQVDAACIGLLEHLRAEYL